MAKQSFPPNPVNGAVAVVAGVTMQFTAETVDTGYWTSVPPEPEELDPENYVERAGDSMTGKLEAVKFVGNFGIEALGDL